MQHLLNKLKRFGYRLATRKAHRITEKGFHSQYGQDRYIAEQVFNGKRNGTFVDIGANDGVNISNTLYFEQELGWNGIAIEPLPKAYQALTNNRKCITFQGCITDFNGETEFSAIEGYSEMLSGIVSKYDEAHVQRIERELKEHGGRQITISVACRTLHSIMQEHALHKVDYMSIDTEGGELDILRSIDFSTLDIDVISVENNYQTMDIFNLMKAHGYRLIALAGSDEIYRKTAG